MPGEKNPIEVCFCMCAAVAVSAGHGHVSVRSLCSCDSQLWPDVTVCHSE